ncbi:MAG: TIGR00730 family Rossman fold protein [Spirochaetia bacterium]
MKICVFCSSSDAVDPAYFSAAAALGALIGSGGHTLVFGGGRVGMMGAVARAVHENGGRVIGIIPDFMHRRAVTYEKCDELTVTADMRERKARMMEAADAFVALPGGFGTLEELSELITQLQFGILKRPLALVNTLGFYDLLARVFEKFYQEKFAKPEMASVLAVVGDPAEAMRHIREFTPPPLVSKWF